MKKYFLYVLAFAITLVSCKKDTKSNLDNSKLVSIDNSEIEKFRKNDQKIEDIINLDSEDIENRKIQYLFGEALANIEWKKEYVEAIVTDAKNSPLKEANILRISEVNRQFANDLNNQLDKLQSGVSLSSIYNNIKYDDKQYQPVLVIPNLENINLELKPIVSHNLEVVEITIDDILAIFIHQNGIKSEILLNENEAVQSQKPIFLFDYGIDDTKYKGLTLALDENQYYNNNEVKHDSSYYANLNNTKGTNGQSQKRFLNIHTSVKSAAYHYETTGLNEYTQRSYPWLNTGSWGMEVFNTSGQRYNRIVRLKKNQCNGSQYTTWDRLVDFSDNYYAANTPFDVFTYRTYERDWNRSQEDMLSSYYKGKTIYPFGKMHRDFHWYINYNWVYNTSAYSLWQYKDIQSYKSKAAFTRSN